MYVSKHYFYQSCIKTLSLCIYVCMYVCLNKNITFIGDDEDGSDEDDSTDHRSHMPDRSGLRDIMKMDLQSSQFDSHCEALMFKLATRLGNSSKT